MSTEIFKWMPHLAEFSFSNQFNVLRSVYENGMTQRRILFPREIGRWSFNFESSLFSLVQRAWIVNEIRAFFKARKGGYDNFYLPSWKFEGRLQTVYDSPTTTFALGTYENPSKPQDAENAEFSAVTGQQGNLLYICSAFQLAHVPSTSAKHEVRRITNISGNVITIDSPFSQLYPKGAVVQKAYKVFFSNNVLEESNTTPYVWKTPIEFTEDIGGLYA